MRFYNHKSSTLYQIYLKIYESELDFDKKKLILKSLLSGESWAWKITAVSKECLNVFKKNKFEKSRKLKKKRKTINNVIRLPFKPFNETASEILITKLSEIEWWEKIYANEKTHLITKEELKHDYYLYIDIPEDGGYFLNGTSGYLYGEKEKLYLRHLSKSKILWKRSNDKNH